MVTRITMVYIYTIQLSNANPSAETMYVVVLEIVIYLLSYAPDPGFTLVRVSAFRKVKNSVYS